MCNRLHRPGSEPDMTEDEYLDSFEDEGRRKKVEDPDNPTKARGISMYLNNYNRLKDERATANCTSIEQYIVKMMDERTDVVQTAALLKGIDRKLTDILMFVRDEFKKMRASFEVVD